MAPQHITQEQADEYAIGALDPQLERAIALHLAECSACRDIVHDSERLASRIALSAPRHRPSPRLKKKVWAAAGISRPTLLHRAMQVAPAAAAIGAVFVAVAAFTGMVSVRNQLNDLRAQNANLQTEISDAKGQQVELLALSERVADAEAANAQQQAAMRTDRELMLAMMSPENDTANLLPTEGNELAIGRLVWDEEQKRVWFVTNRLPQRPPGETYHVWLNADGTYVSLGTFNTDATGFARFERSIPEGIETYDQAIVTIESIATERRYGDAVFVASPLWSLRQQ